MPKPAAVLFPSASSLLSRAWWFTLDHPAEVLLLGLLGSVPFAAPMLFFFREAGETLFFEGTTAAAMKPLAFGLAMLYFVRFPFRLALARWMNETLAGRTASIPRTLGWSLLHLPTALLYGAISLQGWLFGSLLVAPFLFTFQSSMAFHRFASADLNAWAALKASVRIPVFGLGARLLSVCTLVFAFAFIIIWTSPMAAFTLAEWLFEADVAAMREVFALDSVTWIGISAVFPLVGLEILWCVAFGLLSATWQNLSYGTDLLSALDELEAKEAQSM